jgi:hypothetical protein
VRDANRKGVALEASMAPEAFLHPLKLVIIDEADRLKNTSPSRCRAGSEPSPSQSVVIHPPHQTLITCQFRL